MYLKSISFNNYRNLENLELDFDQQINIFIGKNGQGKTNLLEAIYLTTITKSFKTSKFTDLVRFKESLFYVKASIQKNNFPYFIEINYDGTKQFRVNNNSDSKFKDIIGLLNAILFVVDDVSLLKGSPKNRRKLLDIELSKLYPKYLINLSSYYHVLKQRNSILKTSNPDKLIIDTFNTQLQTYGLVLEEYRQSFISKLEKLTNEFYQMISETEMIVTFDYVTNINKDSNSFIDNLEKSYQRDLMMQQTNIGIHRDDFTVYLNDKNAALFASQGEQRTIVLAIKLALVEYIYYEINEYPILLLDDVMSELDFKRQSNLLKYLNKKVQTFITTTDLTNIDTDFSKNGKIFMVNQGFIKE